MLPIDRRDFLKSVVLTTAAATGAAGCGTLSGPTGARRWYKGMLHCHSFWSDGAAFPEEAVRCYRDRGYDFLSLTDHNRLSMRRESWRKVVEASAGWPPKVTHEQLHRYRTDFPWAQTRTGRTGVTEVRLLPYGELLARFNDPGRFLLMPGVEITRGTGGWPLGRQVHVNTINLDDVIPSSKYAHLVQEYFKDLSAGELIRAIREEEELLAAAKGNPPHVVIVNHPHWPYYDLLPEDFLENPEIRFMEICNNGAELEPLDEFRPLDGYDNDRVWDVVNAVRARRGEALLYATGSDDAHVYQGCGLPDAAVDSGDAWTRVKAAALTPEALFAAMDRGHCYAATGLEVDDVSFDGETLRVAVPALDGVTCRVEFVVTKRDFDEKPVRILEFDRRSPGSKLHFNRKVPVYSDEIGRVAETVRGAKGTAFTAAYALKADDLYVRARVISDRLTPFYVRKGCAAATHPRFGTVWTQPYRKGDLFA